MNNKENDNASNFKIKVEDDVISNDSEVAEVFNNYFNVKLKKAKMILDPFRRYLMKSG